MRLTPLLLQNRFPLLRETVKLSPLLTILVQTLLLNALLLPFLFLGHCCVPRRLLARVVCFEHYAGILFLRAG